ncbi:HEAT repeat domain-containing protein [Streptomyces sp. NPDC091371]|uniref:HEAT repeat domain-containing protein n=1 Tax=Streptomyces sp. NPDC091371 TaxID=3155303 RepID=UPI00341E32CC
MRCVINELEAIDWSSMNHAYGPAGDVPLWLRDMRSADPVVREKAFSAFYGAAHHQGDVYPCTTASLPFLFDMADDPEVPDRAAVIGLLLGIGRAAVDGGEGIRIAPDGTESSACADGAAVMRARADAFVRYAADPDPLVRRAAIEGLGLFLDDADRAVEILGGRLPAESGTTERLLVVRTMADLALRLPAARDAATSRLGTLADDTEADPDLRLAALVHRARCVPEGITDEVVPTAIHLLRELTPTPQSAPEGAACRSGAGEGACTDAAAPATAHDVPPQIAAAFEDLARHNRVHAPTTSLLNTFHEVLNARVPARTAVLTEQLRSPDPATRYDAIRMTQNLVTGWRGDHTGLVMLLADLLQLDDPYTAAAAGECLGSLVPVCEPAREALAAYVAAHRTAYGPDVWAAPNPRLRRAHQEAVMALARLGDPRALPCLLTALDSGTDAWRAVQVAGRLGPAAGELVPRLTRRLAAVDFSEEWAGMGAGAVISALGDLGDPTAVPALADAVTAAVRHEQWRTAASAVEALASFGARASSVLEVVRPLADAGDVDLRAAATAALWAIGRDPEGVLPRLNDLLDSYRAHGAADVLGRIGPPAATALPRLRRMLTADYEWTRVHAAAALWDIGGEAEAPLVLQTLLAAWDENEATSNHVLACLNRMGPAAAPALPRIRAELAWPRRSGRFQDITHDEELQRTCRAVAARLARAVT